MKKGFITFLFAIIITAMCFGQRDTLIRNTFELSATAELAAYENNVNFTGYGLQFTYPLGDHFGLNYKLLFGHNTERDFFLHSNMGSYVSVLFLTTSGTVNNIGYVCVLLLIIPEGVSLHIPINKFFRLTPFINPLGVDFWHDKFTQIDYVKGSLDIGIKPTLVLFDKLSVAPSLGYKILYSKTHEKGIEFGISVGFRFKKGYY